MLKSLRPVKVSLDDYSDIQAEIEKIFKEEIFLPLIREMKALSPQVSKLDNSIGYALLRAIQDGRITFYRGKFKGRFTSRISKELRLMGAKWEAKTVSFNLSTSKLPIEVRNAISVSEAKFQQATKSIDKKLSLLNPKEIAEKLSVGKLIDDSIWRVDREIIESMDVASSVLSIQPRLSDDQRAKIALEYNDNMKKYIQEWSEGEIKSLRDRISENTFSGRRYEGIIGEIQTSYGVSQAKAKFLARQETNLYISKLKETLYTESGVPVYRWDCVAGSPGHEVRNSHFLCKGKLFRWDSPYEVDENGEKKRGGVIKPNGDCNPGQDYGCRCNATPQVRF